MLISVFIQYLPAVVVAYAVAQVLATVIYRLYFHPLAKYPGPWLAKLTDGYCAYHNVRGQLHIETEKGHKKWGSVLRQGPNKLVFNTATALHEIYQSSDVQKSTGYTTMVPEPGAFNIFTAVDKSIHRFKRRVLSQGFSDHCIRSFEPTILKHVNIFVKNFRSVLPSEGWSNPVEMTSTCRYWGYDIMGEFGFGQSFQLQTDSVNRFLIDAVTATSRKAGVYVLYPALAKLRLETFFYRKGLAMREKYLDLMSRLVQSRMDASTTSQPDLLTFLVDATDSETGKGFTENELWAESRFLLIAGADTSSTSLASLFFHLTSNDEAYSRLANEVRTTFSSIDEIQSGVALNSCRYLRACIDETLRMSPPISGTLWRTPSPGHTIVVDGHVIPPGTDIGVNPYAIHHNETLYPDHGVFWPERWLSTDKGTDAAARSVARHAFSPFSLGPRRCAGQTMAYTELADTIARTIWGLDFRRARGDLGYVGAGTKGLEGGRGRTNEFQLREHLTCTHDGPWLEFRRRENVRSES